MIDKGTEPLWKIAFYTTVLAPFVERPSSTITPIEVSPKVAFSLIAGTPIFVEEVLDVHSEKSKNRNTYFDRGGLWLKVNVKRFIKELCEKEQPTSRIASLQEAYIWMGRLERGEFFTDVVDMFPKKLRGLKWEEKYIR
jgi:hypothetical protein